MVSVVLAAEVVGTLEVLDVGLWLGLSYCSRRLSRLAHAAGLGRTTLQRKRCELGFICLA